MNIRKQKQAYRYRKQTKGYQWGEQSGEGQDRGIRNLDPASGISIF